MEGTRVFAGRRPFMPRKPAAARLTARTTRYTEPTQASRPSCFLRSRRRGALSARRPKIPSPDSTVRDQDAAGRPAIPSRSMTLAGRHHPSVLGRSLRPNYPAPARRMITTSPRVRIRRGHQAGIQRAKAHAAHAIRKQDSFRGMIVRRRPRGPRPDATRRPRPSGVPTRGYRVPRRSDAASLRSG